jgi:hypothetical protein
MREANRRSTIAPGWNCWLVEEPRRSKTRADPMRSHLASRNRIGPGTALQEGAGSAGHPPPRLEREVRSFSLAPSSGRQCAPLKGQWKHERSFRSASQRRLFFLSGRCRRERRTANGRLGRILGERTVPAHASSAQNQPSRIQDLEHRDLSSRTQADPSLDLSRSRQSLRASLTSSPQAPKSSGDPGEEDG